MIVRTMARAILLIFALGIVGCATMPRVYRDDRPYPIHRMDASDQGVVLRHGMGPDSCDALGARDVWVFKAWDEYVMHYDGAGPRGWLAVRARSKDLLTWTVDGPVLSFGAPGEPDDRSASYGVTTFDGTTWHMFYLGTRFTSPAPDYIPSVPYVTLKATSSSPMGPWVKQSGFVPFKPVPGTYYESTASPGQIIRHNGEYLQFFSAALGAQDLKRTIGLARTRDLDSAWIVDDRPVLPSEEQVENSSLYFEETNGYWFLFTNHVGLYDSTDEYTDAIWVYWTKDPTRWNARNKAVVLDRRNCVWSKRVIGLPSVVRIGKRLAVLYDGVEGDSTSHMRRDIGLAWLPLPLTPPEIEK
jgi:predicted GH43/DUF377 family glycosyl hydrolase